MRQIRGNFGLASCDPAMLAIGKPAAMVIRDAIRPAKSDISLTTNYRSRVASVGRLVFRAIRKKSRKQRVIPEI
jgi:hypothetical protein